MNPNKTAIPKGFEELWRQYPRRVGRGAAIRSYIKVGGQEVLPDILADLKRRTWPDEPQFIPHLSTYLNQWRWMDEPDIKEPTEDDPEFYL